MNRQWIGKRAKDLYETREFSVRDGRPLWMRARNVALVPLVLLLAVYSAFGLVFMVVPARVMQVLVRAPRRLLRRLSRWFQ